MSRFLTLEDLVEQIGKEELLQVAGTGSHNAPEGRSLNEVFIQSHIDFVDGMIGGYLSHRYPHVAEVDVADMPGIIKGIGSDIVRYRLRPRSGDRNTVTEEVRIRYEEALKWLKDVSRGLVHISFTDATTPEANDVPQSGQVRASIPPSRSAALLRGW